MPSSGNVSCYYHHPPPPPLISPCFPVTEHSVWHIVGARQMLAAYKLNTSLYILEP